MFGVYEAHKKFGGWGVRHHYIAVELQNITPHRNAAFWYCRELRAIGCNVFIADHAHPATRNA